MVVSSMSRLISPNHLRLLQRRHPHLYTSSCTLVISDPMTYAAVLGFFAGGGAAFFFSSLAGCSLSVGLTGETDFRLAAWTTLSSSESLSINPSALTFGPLFSPSEGCFARLSRNSSFIVYTLVACQRHRLTLMASAPPSINSTGLQMDDRSLVGWLESIPARV